MELSRKALDDFKKIYQQKHGRVLDDSEANQLGVELLMLMSTLYKKIEGNDYQSQVEKNYARHES